MKERMKQSIKLFFSLTFFFFMGCQDQEFLTRFAQESLKKIGTSEVKDPSETKDPSEVKETSEVKGSSSLRTFDQYEKVGFSHFSLQSERAVEGSGQVVFTQPLDGILKPHLFHLSFSLDRESSQVEFVFFHASVTMTEGLSLEFKRAKQSQDLEVWLHQSGRRSYDISSYFPTKPIGMPFHFRVGIFMNSAGLQLLVWDNRFLQIHRDNAFLDSQFHQWVLKPRHVGSSWGFRCREALVTKAFVTPYYVF
jgi:hypothetical protein